MTFEIVKVQNGYMVFKDRSPYYGDSRGMAGAPPWAFETLENALKFIRDQFEQSPKKN